MDGNQASGVRTGPEFLDNEVITCAPAAHRLTG
jgi:hypothetical protein